MAKFKRKKQLSLSLFLTVSLFLVLLANLIPKIQVYIKKSDATALISFPADHASHPKFKAEWWYLSLTTQTFKQDGSNQKDLSYILSFSRILGNNGLLSSRFDKSTDSFNQKTDIGGNLTVFLTQNKYLYVQYINGNNYAELQELQIGTDRKRSYKLSGKTDQIGLFDLYLKERKVVSNGYNTPLLWGGESPNCTGKISVFAPNDTFYYSIPNLDISGTITDIDGIPREVKNGKAWIDHQWFDSTPPPNWSGHYWSNFHFTQASNFYNTSAPHQAVGFVTQIYNNNEKKYTYWVKRNSDGTNRCGKDANITIKNWGSNNFPSSWKISLKNKVGDIFLNGNGNSFSEKEIFSLPVGPVFIESTSSYKGSHGGKNFIGVGFFETHLTKPQ